MHLDELQEIAAQTRESCASYKHCLRVCRAASCQSVGSDDVLKNLTSKVDESGREDVQIKGVGCMGLCSAGPLVQADASDGAESVLYQQVSTEDVDELFDSLDNQLVERLRCPTDVPFFTRQRKIVLENSGIIDPESIHDYIAAGGYSSLVEALTEMTPEIVLHEVRRSGLRGRGGGGYPAGLKWSTVAKSLETQKYVVCNADEGDPGAFMDRAVLESDPHRVIEGMALAAYAVGGQSWLHLHSRRISVGGRAAEDRRAASHETGTLGPAHL